MSDIERLLKPSEVQEKLSLGRSIVHRMLACGEIPSIIVTNGRRRRSFRVRPADLQRWLRSREVTSASNN